MEIHEFKDIINSDKLNIFVFSASWCRVCAEVWQHLNEILSPKYEEYSSFLLDIDKHSELAKDLGVIGLPSLYIFENGCMKYASLGNISKRKLKVIIKKYSQTSQEFPVR